MRQFWQLIWQGAFSQGQQRAGDQETYEINLSRNLAVFEVCTFGLGLYLPLLASRITKATVEGPNGLP